MLGVCIQNQQPWNSGLFVPGYSACSPAANGSIEYQLLFYPSGCKPSISCSWTTFCLLPHGQTQLCGFVLKSDSPTFPYSTLGPGEGLGFLILSKQTLLAYLSSTHYQSLLNSLLPYLVLVLETTHMHTQIDVSIYYAMCDMSVDISSKIRIRKPTLPLVRLPWQVGLFNKQLPLKSAQLVSSLKFGKFLHFGRTETCPRSQVSDTVLSRQQ